MLALDIMSFFGGGIGSPSGFGAATPNAFGSQQQGQPSMGFAGGMGGSFGSSSFGQPSQTQQTSVFGGSNPVGGFGSGQQSAPAFGGGATSSFGQPVMHSPGGFGAPAAGISSSFLGGGGSAGAFGGMSGTSTFGGTGSVGSFGRSNTTPGGLNLGGTSGGFGSALGRTSPQTGFGSAPATQTSFGGFGAKSPVSTFGQTSAPSGFGGFGAQSPSASISGFGAPSQVASVGFGAPNQSATSSFGMSSGFGAPKPATTFGSTGFGGSTAGAFGQSGLVQQQQQPNLGQQQQLNVGTGNPPYKAHQEKVDEKGKDNRMVSTVKTYNVITCMPAYAGKSTEELRLEDYKKPNKGISSSGGFGFGGNTGGFGMTPAPAPAPAFGSFGTQPTATFGTSTGFGAPAPAPAPAFGSTFGASTGFGAPAPAPAPAFGSTFGASTGFGAKPSTSLVPPATTGGFGSTSFGALAPAPAPSFGSFATGSTFGAPNPAPASTTSFGGFGSGFGAPAPAPAPAFGSTFGANAGFGASSTSFTTSFAPAQAAPLTGFGAAPISAAVAPTSTVPALPGLERIDRMTDRVNQHLGICLSTDAQGDYAVGNQQLGHTLVAPSYRQPTVRPARRTKIVSSEGTAATPSGQLSSLVPVSPASPDMSIQLTPGQSPRIATPDERLRQASPLGSDAFDPSAVRSTLGPLEQLQAAIQRTAMPPTPVGMDRALAATPNSLTPQSISSEKSPGLGVSPNGSGQHVKTTNLNLPEDYITSPDITILQSMTQEQLKVVVDFKISRPMFGSIHWAEPVDLSNGADLSEYVQFSTNSKGYADVAVHELRAVPLGERLNRKALITLQNMFPKESWPKEKQDNFASYLRANNERSGATFCSYNKDRGEWKFFVEHFSRWGFADDDSEDDVPVAATAFAQTGTAAIQSGVNALKSTGQSAASKENASQMQVHPLNMTGPVEAGKSSIMPPPSGAGPSVLKFASTSAVSFAPPSTPFQSAPWSVSMSPAELTPSRNSSDTSMLTRFAAHTPFQVLETSNLEASLSPTTASTSTLAGRTPFQSKSSPTNLFSEGKLFVSQNLTDDSFSAGSARALALEPDERSPLRRSPAFPYDGRRRARLQEIALACPEPEKFTTYNAQSPCMDALLKARAHMGRSKFPPMESTAAPCAALTRVQTTKNTSAHLVTPVPMRNFGLSMGRSFRVGWSRDGRLAHAGLPCVSTSSINLPQCRPQAHRHQHAICIEHISLSDTFSRSATAGAFPTGNAECSDHTRGLAQLMQAVLTASVRRRVPGDEASAVNPDEDNLNSDVAPLWQLPTQAPVDLTHYGRFLALLKQLQKAIGNTSITPTHPDWNLLQAITLVNAACGQEEHVAEAIITRSYKPSETIAGEPFVDSLLPLFEKRAGVPTTLWERRRQMFSRWFQAATSAQLDLDLPSVLRTVRTGGSAADGEDSLATDTPEQEDGLDYAASQIFDLLCLHRIADAAKVAQEAGLWRLSTIIVQLDGDSSIGLLMRQQLQLWVMHDYDRTIPKALLDVYRLIAGEFVCRSGSVNDSMNMEPIVDYKNANSVFANQGAGPCWERSLAAIFWYAGHGGALADMCGLGSCTDEEYGKVSTALRLYRSALDLQSVNMMSVEGNSQRLVDPPTTLHNSNRTSTTISGVFSLMELLLTEGNDEIETEESMLQSVRALSSDGYSSDPMDYRVPYIVLVLLECLGFVDQADAHASIVRQHMIFQLTRAGMWKWALVVALQITDHKIRTVIARDLLQRWAGAVGWQQQMDCDENFLREQLKMPVSWIHEATAYRCGSYAPSVMRLDAGSQAKYFIEAYLTSGKFLDNGAIIAPGERRAAPTGVCLRRRGRLRDSALDVICSKIAPLAMLKLGNSVSDRLAELLDLLNPSGAEPQALTEGHPQWSDLNDILQRFFTLKSDVQQLADFALTTPAVDKQGNTINVQMDCDEPLASDAELRQQQLEAVRDELMAMTTELLKRVCSVQPAALSSHEVMLFTGGRRKQPTNTVRNGETDRASVSKNLTVPTLLQVTQLEIGSALCEYLMRLLKSQHELAQNDPTLGSAELVDTEAQYMHAQLYVLTELQHLPFPSVLDKTQLQLLRSTALLCLRSVTRRLTPIDGGKDSMQQ